MKRFSFLFFLLSVLNLSSAYAQYCTPIYSSSCTSDDYIDGVVFGAINNVGTGCSNTTTNYTYYSTMAAVVSPGLSYPITLIPSTAWSQGFGVWIDINQDNDFADAGEFVFSSPSSNTPVNGNISIPAIALSGQTRMRVMCRFGTQPVATDVCSTTLSYGEVEDYNLAILPQAANDIGITALGGPASGCGLGMEQIVVTIANFGSNLQSNFTVSFSVDGGAPFVENPGLTLNPSQTATYTFANLADLTTPGTHTIQAWTTLAGDAYAINDAQTITVLHKPAITSFPYFEDFEHGGLEPNGWDNVVADAGDNWIIGTGSTPNWSTGPDFDHTMGASGGGYYAYVYDNWNDYDSVIYITPCFDLSALGHPEFSFWFHSNESGGGGFPGDVNELHIDMLYNGTLMMDFIPPIGHKNNFWTQNIIDLQGYTGVVGFRFRVNSSNGNTSHDIAIDDLMLTDLIPQDAKITNLIAPANPVCGLGSNETITVELVNTGTDPFSSCPMMYQLDGGLWQNAVYNGLMNPGDVVNYSFPVGGDFSAMGNHTLVVVCDLPGDTNIGNDTLTEVVVNTPLINTFPYVEDFETSAGFWETSGMAGTSFKWTVPTNFVLNSAYSGTKCWVTDLDPTNTTGSEYSAGEVSWVMSPCMDFSGLGAPLLEMGVSWYSETGYDGAVLQYTLDAGNTWQNVGAFGDPDFWYNDDDIWGMNNLGTQNPSLDAWCGSSTQTASNGWKLAKHDLFNLAGQPSVRFRVLFAADGSVQYDGFAFDKFYIYDKPANETGVTSINAPLGGYCEDATLDVEVTIENFGSQPQSNLQVTVQVGGANSTTITGFYPGPLLPFQTATFTVGSFNAPNPGPTTLTAFTVLAGDTIPANDSSFAAISIFEQPGLPVVSDVFACNPDSFLISAGGGSDLYSWYASATATTPLAQGVDFQTPLISTNTTYYVEGENNIQLHLGAPDKNIGNGGGNSSYSDGLLFDVNNAVKLDSVTIYPGTSGNVNVILVNSANTILNSRTLTVTVSSPFQAVRIPVEFDLTPGTGYKLIAQGSTVQTLYRNFFGASYPYSDPNGNVEITNTVNNQGANGYYMFFYDWLITVPGCKSARVPVTVHIQPSPTVNLGLDQVLCGGSLTIVPTVTNGGTYSWSTGATTPSITVSNSGLYELTVTSGACSATDAINVSILPPASVDLGADQTTCQPPITLSVGNQPAGTVYQWSNNLNGSTAPTAQVTTSGVYWVTVTAPGGCIDRDTVNITINNGPSVNLGPDITTCNTSVTLNPGTSSGTSYFWSNGATTPTITVTTSGTYTVVGTTGGGCSATDAITVTIAPTPIVNLGADITACNSAVLNAGNVGNSYLWQPGGMTSQVVNVTNSGIYFVTVTNAGGCSDTDSISVTINEQAQAGFTYTLGGMTASFNNTTVNGYGTMSYLWNFGDGTTATTVNAVHTFTTAGTYTVSLTVTDACGSNTYTYPITIYHVGVDEALGGTIRLFPNPSNGIFTVNAENIESTNLNMEVVNMEGKVIFQQTLSTFGGSFVEEFQLQNIAAGMYLVRFTDGENVALRKLVIE